MYWLTDCIRQQAGSYGESRSPNGTGFSREAFAVAVAVDLDLDLDLLRGSRDTANRDLGAG
jgi:hypothetical protein